MEENLKQQPTDLIKIALYGPESTGKTTLAKQLAKHFQTIWVEEFARDYLQKKWDDSKNICTPEDLLPIAIGQVKIENEALKLADKYLFCDTNLMCTKVFSEIYYGFCEPFLEKAAKKHKYDLFFLTDIDVPFEKDDLRDKPEERDMLMQKFEQALIDNKKPYVKLSGNENERLEKAISSIEALEKAKKMGFDSYDYVQMKNLQVSIDDVEAHLNIFKNGIPKTNLEKPATIKNGILPLSDEEAVYYSNFFDQKKEKLKLQKFVPASGAASRMFKFLSEFLNDFKANEETLNAYINRKKCSGLPVFVIGLEKFPFYKEVSNYIKKQVPDFDKYSNDKRIFLFIKTLLSPSQFDFASKPKGILPFHEYVDHTATPIEEHLNESGFYAASKGISNLHFTISEEHQEAFEKIIAETKDKVEQSSKTKINIDFSYQHKSTDTIATDLNGEPFRLQNGELFFRPGGHGALIQNLNALNADIIFIKNIDNVIQNHISEIALYKKALAGLLIEIQEKIFFYLKELESERANKDLIEEIVNFAKEKIHCPVIADFSKYTKESKIEFLQELLNRPVRVCGMVKNEGEPGGGPFWVRGLKGNLSLQIVESSQVDLKNPNQLKIMAQSTHFNPVDLVCGVNDYKNNKFDLTKFIDHNSGFIAEKTKNGKDIKAYELPGLWNGAMASWITLFVEVPLITFNPVKTVNDLLKQAHQPQ